MSGIAASPSGLLTPVSVTIIRTDPLSDLPPGLSTAERVARFTKAIGLVLAPDIGNPDKFRLDVTRQQTHRVQYQASVHPVEQGVRITDHVRRVPDRFTFEGLIVDSPFIPFSPAGAIPLQLNRAHKQLTSLLAFAEDRVPLFVASSTKVYENMIITSIEWQRDVDSGSSIPIAIEMQEILIRLDIVGDPLIDETAAVLGGSTVNDAGSQVAS